MSANCRRVMKIMLRQQNQNGYKVIERVNDVPELLYNETCKILKIWFVEIFFNYCLFNVCFKQKSNRIM